MVFVQKINLEKKKRNQRLEAVNSLLFIWHIITGHKKPVSYNGWPDTASLHCVGDELYSQGGYI
jgi:hypothetical protein